MRYLILSAILLVFYVFSFYFVSAVEVGVSPAELVFPDSESEECKEIKLMSNYKTLFNLNDKWNIISSSRNPVFYNVNADKVGIEIIYDRQIVVDNGYEMVDICLKSVKKGNKRGILFFESNSASLGVRIEVLSGKIAEKENIGITGSIVENLGNSVNESIDFKNFLFYLTGVNFILLFLLVFFLYRKRSLA
jgi:hypothetical protein